MAECLESVFGAAPTSQPCQLCKNACAFHLLLSLAYASGHVTGITGLFFPLFQVWFYPFSLSSAGDNTEPGLSAPITNTVHYWVRGHGACAWHRLGPGRMLPASPMGALGWSLLYLHAGPSVMLHSTHPSTDSPPSPANQSQSPGILNQLTLVFEVCSDYLPALAVNLCLKQLSAFLSGL